MTHRRRGWFAVLAALLCAGCLTNATPNPPTAALITATALPASSSAPASPTAIAIITATPTVAPLTETPGSVTAAGNSTASPEIPTSTLIASETATSAAASSRTPAPAASSAPTIPAHATAPAVGIISFSINPPTINPGDSVTLAWQATGQQADIYRVDQGQLIELTDTHSVPLSGTLSLRTPDSLRNRVDYILFAAAGGSTASATVSAIIRCPDKWFLTNQPAGCPMYPGTQVPMAAEHFQHGVMLWLSSQDMIFILFGDGNTPQWANDPNKWMQGQPESDPSLIAPAGLYQPVRGFGLLWRTGMDATADSGVRDRLGWATEPEVALNGSYQCDSAPKYNQCFISGPGGVVYHLVPEGSRWEVWQGP